ncbi:PREDICTED: DNA-directed RNA polymerase IV subunit 1-like [Populus euphratica]|uniref:DNA-directed RNA polymerase subunit n=1 Tax=Populus euphratica TaxID=75702 RepID=A0AAJ6XD53_POPEU|nr:PREDICTED: DNA-directed RNA polymerase IV subunit 1-like [Populus euphratica]XP_011014514.1 PREDICTED: DNA-directed RNA polymerase IV subunit 1-like [Populus euphratica]XP_011014516.1 PREDICTED: DNA-directed RNA polymerase IV subunit 1-like [Populus euphratica]XP_011014517.1 PREDICTED: DNA-directed RNA polymerase IV subunit 1-like [Populus euphratica]XP_011014518.1 PREDICTED: DNA-directed RNA polymerase IV subunit 1-like [Populus euphratica]XP_011014519.1 PREDICTED: DNA-directed RNA polymer
MEIDFSEEHQVPSALITGIAFGVLTEADMEKLSVLNIDALSEVTNPKLGLPNPSSQCPTCGSRDLKSCEGHFGVINFPYTIVHPYFLSEVVQILNKICPGCKSIRLAKATELITKENPQRKGCKYCAGNSLGWYPPMKFKVSSKEIFRKTAIIAEIRETLSNKPQKGFKKILAADYWDIFPKDEQEEEEETNAKPNRRVLSHSQVRHMLKDVDPNLIKLSILKTNTIFLNCFPVTPNSHRVTEVTHAFSNGQRLIFDERTRAYKKMVDFRGVANTLSFHVMDCLKTSKLNPDKSGNIDPWTAQPKKSNDYVNNASGLRWIKDVILGKRNDHSFRMVLVGDPNLQLHEIGIPCHIAERLQVSESLTAWNWEKLNACFEKSRFEKGDMHVRREGNLVRVRHMKELRLGDIIYRPLNDGDTVLINRPPSIHQHSLIALCVKVLPVPSVLAINPLCCPPFRADFDGDCLHGYVPQSVDTRVELTELVSLDKQLTNWQSGRNLLSLSQDSLTAAHLVLEDDVFLSSFELQQLQMFRPERFLLPAVKAPSANALVWTGRQLISMLLPVGFDHDFPSCNVCIRDGDLVSSEGSFWLWDTDGNLFQSLVKHCHGQVLDFLYAAQRVLCEWLSMRGLSVSLSDLYLCPDSNSRKNMMDEIWYGLQDADYACNLKHLMVDSCRDFLTGNNEEDQCNVERLRFLSGCSEEDYCVMAFDGERLCYEKQRSAALSQSSVDAFRLVFRDIQSLVYRYASKDNSFLAMFKAGSKGNLLKLVQHSMCLGLQHALASLSFRMPHQLSCAGWNKQKADDATESAKRYIPHAVVEGSFLSGLNPIECFVHSVTSRDSSFSDNADLPGTLFRRMMFFMRDLHGAYDGTVRNAYGNQLVQFSYNIDDMDPSSSVDEINKGDGIAGRPVGPLAACAISEAAYSALDQPISLLEKSPLLNLKNVLECGLKRNSAHQTMSLFLSEKLGRQRHGFEYAALEVQNHLERLLFSDIVSFVRIIFSPQSDGRMHFSPWVCHFHVYKEIVKKRSLKMHYIIDALDKQCKSKTRFPKVQITSRYCTVADTWKEKKETFCITVTIVETSKNEFIELETIQDLMIPFLLETVIKGFMEIRKVDILWNDKPKIPKSHNRLRGELFLRVHMSRGSDKTRLWNQLMDDCLSIMDIIDWARSHPDNIHECCLAYGIDAGWKFFLNNLQSAMSDVGKTLLPEHLLLVANCLSVTGEFVGLNAKGLKRQREHASVSTPFVQACFSNPGDCFIRAAKAGVVDDLQGSIDALAWGKIPAIGTGQFDIVYSGKGLEFSKPVDVYNLLGSQMITPGQNTEFGVLDAQIYKSDKCGAQFLHKFGGCGRKGFKVKEGIPRSFLRRLLTYDDIQRMSYTVRKILKKYSVDQQLNERDKSVLMMTLYFHPRRDEKIGIGAKDIKVINHPEYQDTRCFSLVRTDGTIEDFSYRKCLHNALEIIAPQRAQRYCEKYLTSKAAATDNSGCTDLPSDN